MANRKLSKPRRLRPDRPRLVLKARRDGLDLNVTAHGKTAIAGFMAIAVAIVLGLLLR